MTGSYVPERGDVIWLQSGPQAGREQAGHRPALVLSPRSYNRRAGLLVACPITSRAKGYPFEVKLPAGSDVEGVVLSDHVKSLDWRERRAAFAAKAPAELTSAVSARLTALVGGLK